MSEVAVSEPGAGLAEVERQLAEADAAFAWEVGADGARDAISYEDANRWGGECLKRHASRHPKGPAQA